MKTVDKLLALAALLENNSDILDSAKDDEIDLVATALVVASDSLKFAADSLFENSEAPEITDEKLETIAALAQALDDSDDEFLQKQASVLDEILLTIAHPKHVLAEFKAKEYDRLEELKKKYKNQPEREDNEKYAVEAKKELEKNEYYKEYKPLEAALSTRTCPDHPGAQIARVGEHVWQCAMDNKVYDYETGFTTLSGNKVPGGGVEYQTKEYLKPESIFTTREDVTRK